MLKHGASDPKVGTGFGRNPMLKPDVEDEGPARHAVARRRTTTATAAPGLV